MQLFDPSPLIVNLAPTGAVSKPERNPHLPVSEAAIVGDVVACAARGVAIAHLHVRDAGGQPSSDPGRFADLIRRLRAETRDTGLILCASTSGRHGQSPAQRAAVLDLPDDARPDMASLTLGSLNFVSGASVNPPDTIRFLAERMLERAIKPELEIFDLGMVHFANRLIEEGLLQPPFYFNLFLGNPGSAQADLADLAALLRHLPADSVWSLGGIGRTQRAATALACIAAPAVRIGLEDNLWRNGGTREAWTNPAMIDWLVGLAAAYGRPLATAAETRRRLWPDARTP